MNEISPTEVLEWPTEKLWAYFQVVCETEDVDPDEVDRVKLGDKLRFPIYNIVENWYEIYPTNNKVTVHGYGKFPLTEFMDELSMRQTLMRRIIIETLEDGEITAPRT